MSLYMLIHIDKCNVTPYVYKVSHPTRPMKIPNTNSASDQ